MRGYADRAPAVTADSCCRAPTGDRRGFSSARPSRRPRQIPRIVRSSIKEIIGFPCHQEFGRVGHADHDGAGPSQSGHKGSVARCDVSLAQLRAGLASHPGHIDRTFNGDRNAVERTQLLHCSDCGFCCTRLSKRTLGVNLYEGVDFGLQELDTRKVRFNQFDWRNLFFANELCHAHSRQKN
jgi:hypothetical protein